MAADPVGSGVDLNSDLGESFGRWTLGDDEAMLQVVTSASVACGFHAGDPSTVRRTCAAASARGVVIGAQVSYPDLAGFGRRFMDLDPGELTDGVLYQIGALEALARAEGGRVAYVKAHGALYHAVIDHPAQAAAVVRAVREHAGDLALLGLPSSTLLRLAEEEGMATVGEAFADRAYTPDGRLLARSEVGAVLHDPAVVAARVVRMAVAGEVEAVDGSVVRLDTESICIHGDTTSAVAIARTARRALEDAGVPLRAFTG